MSRRSRFKKLRDLKDNLKKYNAFSVDGYFPLFNNIDDAMFVSPVSSYHTHEFEGVEYYMPDGLTMNKTQFHGDYKEQIKQEVGGSLEQQEQLPIIEDTIVSQQIQEPLPQPVPQPTPTPIYIPPPSTPSGGSGGGGY